MSGWSSKWSEEKTIQFINEYISHECLWNSRHVQYKIRSARMAAYKTMERSLNIPNFGVKEIVTKIKNIRTTYSGEVRKIRDSIKLGGPVYVPSVKWFPILESVLGPIGHSDVISFQSDLDHNRTETADNSTIETNIDDTHYNVDESQDTQTINGQLLPTKKRRIQELSVLLAKVKEVSEINNRPPPEEHEFDIFGRSVAAQLKAMPLDKAIQAQHFIQSYITGLRLQECPSSPSSVDGPSPHSPQANVELKIEQMSP